MKSKRLIGRKRAMKTLEMRDVTLGSNARLRPMPEDVCQHKRWRLSVRARALRLHALDVVEQHLLVTFGIHVAIDLTQVAFGIDHETRALPVHRAFVFTLAHVCRVQELVLRIRE